MIWLEISLILALIRAFGWWHRRMVTATDRRLADAATATAPGPVRATYGDYTRTVGEDPIWTAGPGEFMVRPGPPPVFTNRAGTYMRYGTKVVPTMRVVWDEPLRPARYWWEAGMMNPDPPRKYHLEPVADDAPHLVSRREYEEHMRRFG